MSNGEVARWKKHRDHFVGLGIHPRIAGALAWQLIDSDALPESVSDTAQGLFDEMQIKTSSGARPGAPRKNITRR